MATAPKYATAVATASKYAQISSRKFITMSYISGLISCPQVQLSLLDTWAYNNLAGDPTPIMQVLLSDVNRRDTVQRVTSPGNGKRRQVEVTYEQRFLESIVSSGGRIVCGGGSTSGELSKTYEVTASDGFHVKWSVDMAELETRCEADPTYISRQILKHMNALLSRAETYVSAQVALNLGNFASDVDAGNPAGTSTNKQGTGFNTNGTISYDLSNVIKYEFTANDYNGPIVALGGEDLWKYANALVASTADNDLGVQPEILRQNAGINYGYSRKMAAALGGSQYLLGMMPGSIQILSFNEFAGADGNPRVIDDNALKQGTLQHPTIPVIFDYYAEYACSGSDRTWNFGLAFNFDTAFLPSDMFAIGDRMEGVNGLLQFEVI